MSSPIEQLCQEFGIVGRRSELGQIMLALAAGRHLLLEGPVGVGKTTIATAAAVSLNKEVIRVDGDSRFSE
jgi:MoxR-like ATPase